MRSFFVILFAVSFILSSSAHAAMSFCNKTEGTIEAALGYRDDAKEKNSTWVAEGWWRIEPGQCARVKPEALTQRFYFYYARTLPFSTPDARRATWTGKYIFCTDKGAFRIEGDGNCTARGYKTTGFQELDIGEKMSDYTLDFKSKHRH